MSKKLTKSAAVLAALSLLMVLGLTGCGGQVAATVNGQVITQEDLDLAMKPYLGYITGMEGSLEECIDVMEEAFTEHPEDIVALFSQYYGIQLTEADLEPIKENMLEELYDQYYLGEGQCLNGLIERALILQEAEKQGLKLEPSELQQQWKKIKQDHSEPLEWAEWMVSNNCYNEIMFEKMQQEDHQFSEIYDLNEENYEQYITDLYDQADIYVAASYQDLLAKAREAQKEAWLEDSDAEEELEENIETSELDEDTLAADSSGRIIVPDSNAADIAE